MLFHGAIVVGLIGLVVVLIVILIVILNKEDETTFTYDWLSLNSNVSADIQNVAKQKLLNCVKASPVGNLQVQVYYKTYPQGSTTLGEASWSTKQIWLNSAYQNSQVNFNDTSQHLLGVVLLHEILHVMGLLCLSPQSQSYCSGTQYTGPYALAKFNEMRAKHSQSPASFIPIETDYGSGTAGVHVDEDGGNTHTILTEEIQSGVLNTNNYFTSLTLGLLQDAGWLVDYDCGEVMDQSPNMTWQ